jgi:hypothetical protein
MDTLTVAKNINVVPLGGVGSRQILFFGEQSTVGYATRDKNVPPFAKPQPVPSSGHVARGAVVNAVSIPVLGNFGRDNLSAPLSHDQAVPQAVLENWSRLYRAGLPEPVYTRIRHLARYDDGWRGLGSKGLSTQSLRTFLNFWIQIKTDASPPEVALTARGTLQAEWFQNSRRHLDLEFVNDRKIFFGLFHDRNVNEGVYSLGALVQWLKNQSAKPMRLRTK